ncbi:hypothetical protein JGU66_02410 [Myxococcaceae bacterium JPH2]|nr:hypothetical protein [Myxococcaceae bacterium JPH2]
MHGRWMMAALVAAGVLVGCDGAGTGSAEQPLLSQAQGVRASTRAARRFPERLHIPVPDFFPEGIAHANDGTFFVGSYADGRVMRQRPGASWMEPFLAPTGRAVAGMKVHDATHTLWLCDLDLSQATPDQLRAYDSRTGAARGAWAFPAGGLCNDLTLDSQGTVYVTDSFLGVVRRLKPNGKTLETWASDPARFMAPPGVPGLNGIAWADGAVYVVKYDSGDLFRVDVRPDGNAGAITAITPNAPIGYPDGIVFQSPGVLLVVDNDNGRFLKLNLSGDSAAVTVLATGFDNPTTVALHDGDAFVVQSQFDHFFGVDVTPPDMPFAVKRVWLR